jgi:hypothetical protein
MRSGAKRDCNELCIMHIGKAGREGIVLLCIGKD